MHRSKIVIFIFFLIVLSTYLFLYIPHMKEAKTFTQSSTVLDAQQTITIILGEKKEFSEFPFSISFKRAIEDSRCPKSANCAWAGRVVVELELLESQELSLIEIEEGSTAYAGKFVINLISVHPTPDLKNKSPEKPRIVLNISTNFQ